MQVAPANGRCIKADDDICCIEDSRDRYVDNRHVVCLAQLGNSTHHGNHVCDKSVELRKYSGKRSEAPGDTWLSALFIYLSFLFGTAKDSYSASSFRQGANMQVAVMSTFVERFHSAKIGHSDYSACV